jgi:poly(A) polymerase
MELFPDVPLSEQLEVCRYLRTSNHDGKLVESIYRMREMVQNEQKGNNHVDLFDWANLYTHPQSQICLEVVASRFDEEERRFFLERHAERRAQLLPHIQRIQQKKAVLSAETLKSLGLGQGKVLGDLMKEAEKIAVREDLHDETSVLKALKKGPLWEKFERGQK